MLYVKNHLSLKGIFDDKQSEMQTSIIPGYYEIFGKDDETYEKLIHNLSSNTVITLCSSLNNELYSPETREVNQSRLNSIVSLRFSKIQNTYLNEAFLKFSERTGKQFKGFVFFRRYLLSMVIKELNNYREVSDYVDNPMDEYNFLRAYLKIIDEVNSSDHGILNFRELIKNDATNRFKLIWLPTLKQFEFNEKCNFIFETLKALCLLKYTSEHYKPYLKEYLEKLNLETPGALMGSFYQLYGSTNNYDETQMLRKYTIISPSPGVDRTHILSQTINEKIGNTKISFSELKKRPIFYNKQREGFILLDNHLANNKIFRGTYFDLYKQTSLKDQEIFTKTQKQEVFIKYSQDIAEVLEKTCLCPILTLLDSSLCDKFHFDDATDSVPDGYLRIGNKIFLFEYKAYFFPEKLAAEPNFEKMKKYLDDRFIENEKGSAKGIGQIKKQIDIILTGGFDFDPGVKQYLQSGDLYIYPLITYNDFNFSLPGINLYLNEAFQKLIAEIPRGMIIIHPLVLVNLEVILDLIVTGQNILDFEKYLVSYINLISDAHTALNIDHLQETFHRANSSFDEIYNWLFIEKLEDPKSIQPILKKLLQMANLSFEELNQPL